MFKGSIRDCIARIANCIPGSAPPVTRESLGLDRDTPLKDRELLSTEREAIEREERERRNG